jgi:hypothetical protein
VDLSSFAEADRAGERRGFLPPCRQIWGVSFICSKSLCSAVEMVEIADGLIIKSVHAEHAKTDEYI